jgi:hypothetical protein
MRKLSPLKKKNFQAYVDRIYIATRKVFSAQQQNVFLQMRMLHFALILCSALFLPHLLLHDEMLAVGSVQN